MPLLLAFFSTPVEDVRFFIGFETIIVLIFYSFLFSFFFELLCSSPTFPF
jgi:hypothetical protein